MKEINSAEWSHIKKVIPSVLGHQMKNLHGDSNYNVKLTAYNNEHLGSSSSIAQINTAGRFIDYFEIFLVVLK